MAKQRVKQRHKEREMNDEYKDYTQAENRKGLYIRPDGSNGYNVYDRYAPNPENRTGHDCVQLALTWEQAEQFQLTGEAF